MSAQIEAAYESLYKRLVSYAHRHIGDYYEAQDAVHDAFAAALSEWQEGGSLRSWLYKATRNRCLDRLRHKKVMRRVMADADWGDVERTAQGPDVIAVVELRIEADALLASVTVVHRQCVLLRAAGLRSAEIGARLGLRPQVVRRKQMEVWRRAKVG